MFRLAHISDVHLSPLPKMTLPPLFSKRVTGYLNWRLNRSRSYDRAYLDAIIESIGESKVDHLAITGDLVNLSLKAETQNVTKWLNGIANELAFENEIIVIAGNHDAYVPGSLARCFREWQHFVKGDDGATVTGNRHFPLVRHRDSVALISCNSARATRPFSARGYFDKRQADALGELLQKEGERGKFRIVMIHHPPFHGATRPGKRLQNIDRFQAVIQSSGCELILHGHTHLATTTWIDGQTHKVPVIGVPAAAQVPGSINPAAAYNLFEIEKAGEKWTCNLRSFGYSETHALPNAPTLLLDQKLL